MADNRTQGADGDLIARGAGEPPFDPHKYTLEQLVLLVTAERLHHIEKSSRDELKELAARQARVRKLHDLLAKINSLTDSTGKVKVDAELRKMLEAVAKEEGLSLDIKEVGKVYESTGRDRLVENLRMHVDDLNLQNDMQIQAVTRMNNERYESYQLARSILKPLDEDKKNKARAMRGS